MPSVGAERPCVSSQLSRGGVRDPTKTPRRAAGIHSSTTGGSAGEQEHRQTRLAAMKQKVEAMPVVQASGRPLSGGAMPNPANPGRLRGQDCPVSEGRWGGEERLPRRARRVRSLASNRGVQREGPGDAVKESHRASFPTTSSIPPRTEPVRGW